jgi:PAS domain S-box-containing protein
METSDFELLFEQSPVGIAVVSLDGVFLKANPKLQQILGYTSYELEKLTFMDITHPEDVDADVHMLRKVKAGEINSYEMIKRYITKTQKLILIRLNVSAAKDENENTIHFIAHIQPIINGERLLENKLLEISSNKPTVAVGQFISENWKSLIAGIFIFLSAAIPISATYLNTIQKVNEIDSNYEELLEIIRDKVLK